MELMQIRRGLMASMAGGRIPSNISIRDFTVELTANDHQIPHGLNAIPEMFLIIPKVKQTGTGANNPYNLSGYALGGSGLTDYPNKLVSSFALTSGNWDYSANNQGWIADTTNINLHFNISSRFHVGNYTLIAYAYE